MGFPGRGGDGQRQWETTVTLFEQERVGTAPEGGAGPEGARAVICRP